MTISEKDLDQCALLLLWQTVADKQGSGGKDLLSTAVVRRTWLRLSYHSIHVTNNRGFNHAGLSTRV